MRPRRTVRFRAPWWAGLAVFADEAPLFQETEVAGHARLRDAEDAGQLRHVQAVERDEPEEAEPHLVAEQPIQRRGVIHIH